MSKKILLDTDIGSDIDDIVALTYLLAHPACDLLGITTVSGEAEKRARIASAICNMVGNEIPIFPGRDDSLIVKQLQPFAQQASVLANWNHQNRFPKGEAVPFMREMIRQHAGEITLVTLGPLTNIAALFSIDDEIPSLLDGVVSMCGLFKYCHPNRYLREWNAMLDPHAAAIVYHTKVRKHASFGLDVTIRLEKNADEVRSLFTHAFFQPVLDFAEVWFADHDSIIFHDPLTVVSLFEQDLCQFENGEIEVELASASLAGLTHWQPSRGGRHAVAVDVDADRFFSRYFSVFS